MAYYLQSCELNPPIPCIDLKYTDSNYLSKIVKVSYSYEQKGEQIFILRSLISQSTIKQKHTFLHL